MAMLGLRIKEGRKQLALNQEQLAEKVGTTQARISRIESGKDRLFTEKQIKPFSKVLKIPLQELMDLQQKESNGRIYVEATEEGTYLSADSSSNNLIGDNAEYFKKPKEKYTRLALEQYLAAPEEIQEKINIFILSTMKDHLESKKDDSDSKVGEDT